MVFVSPLQGVVAPAYVAEQLPGPMQSQYSSVPRPRPARRPIAIETPLDVNAGVYKPSEASGSRRYSAMTQYTQ